MEVVPVEHFEFQQPSEAPVFEPSINEFDDPISYISKIRPVAEKYGICRIIPPEEWRPPFSVDLNKFTFNPRVQPLKELEATTRVKLMFLQNLAEFWELMGTSLKLPVVEKKVLDLYVLDQLVKKEGGFINATTNRKWSYISHTMGFQPDKNHGMAIKSHYERWLGPYNTIQKTNFDRRRRKKGVEVLTGSVKRGVNPGCISFSKRLCEFWRRKGMRLSWPLIDKKSVDLFALHEAASTAGGLVDWCSIARSMQFKENSASDLRLCYNKLIKPFVESGGEESVQDADVCDKCMLNDNAENIVVCVGCGTVYHLDCLRPQLIDYSKVPKGNWNCYACIKEKLNKSREPYGFDQAEKHYTLEEFGQMAVQFKEEHFGMPCLSVPIEEVEKEYWRLLTDLEHDTMVEYGADIHSVDHGMGFPLRDEANSVKMETDEYTQSKWNLNNIPVIETSVYSHIGTNVPGVTIPWMYIGMCFSTFCWHIEDHWSYSINYLHWGEPKTWYGIPGKDAELFEKVLKNVAPVLFDGQPDLLHDLSTTVNPNTLMKHGMKIFRTDQKAGEFVVTFPRAYHAGFNQGFNFAEAVNFAPADWIPIGRACIDHYASLLHVCVFSHDELICKLAKKGSSLDQSLVKATLKDMAVMLESESNKRKLITKSGVTKTERVIFEKIPDDNRQCAHCKTTCFLSAVKCSCREDIFCINDYFKIKEACGCPPSNFIFKYRYDLDELLTLITNCKVHLAKN
uniref:[histone H3]-trimethyl-L-lysine(4) demethylase n=3 Tax=Lygus hesperus TaxID=30085 RepID=A0A0A9W3X8_LYGHE